METIELKHPFEHEGVKYESVKFKDRLKANDLLKSELEMEANGIENPGDATRTLYLVAQAIKQPVEMVKAMDLADYLSLGEKVKAFL